MLKIFISFVVASVAVIAALIFTGASLSQYVAVLISASACWVGVGSRSHARGWNAVPSGSVTALRRPRRVILIGMVTW